MSRRRASGRSPKIIERGPSTRDADGVSPVGRVSCRSRPIRSTSSTPARHFAVSRASGASPGAALAAETRRADIEERESRSWAVGAFRPGNQSTACVEDVPPRPRSKSDRAASADTPDIPVLPSRAVVMKALVHPQEDVVSGDVISAVIAHLPLALAITEVGAFDAPQQLRSLVDTRAFGAGTC